MDSYEVNSVCVEYERPCRRELVFKFLVIGDYGVGKTAIVRRYTEGKFSSNYKITIGADFSVKTIQWDVNTRVSLQLWDVAGHERFGYMTRIYYKYAIGCLVVFDLTRYSSFQSVDRWINDLNDKVVLDNGSEIPTVLLANKTDIGESCVSDDAINRFCRERRLRGWFKTSAKNNLNIDEAVNSLIGAAIELTKPSRDSEPPRAAPSTDAVRLSSLKQSTPKTPCC